MKKILLIGDTILDIYVYGHAIGKSAETPTIVAKELETRHSLGGAFLVARNLLELGAHVKFLTLTGTDDESAHIQDFAHPQLEKLLVRDPSRRTTAKKRYWVDGYKLLQFDTLDNRPLSDELQNEASRTLSSAAQDCDTIVVSDYQHGFLKPILIRGALDTARHTGKPLYIDSQVSQSRSNHLDYRGADLFCLNHKEAQCILPDFPARPTLDHLQALRRALDAKHVVVKLGELGSIALVNGTLYSTPALQIQPVDTCGAGDAFLSALCMGDLQTPEVALRTANTWAGLSTLVHGAQPASRADLEKALL